MFMSALDPLLRHEIEAQLAGVAMHELVQRRVARRSIRRFAQLQNVFGGVLRAQLEGVDRPLLDGADTSTRREFPLGGLIEKVRRSLDAVAAGHMNPCTVSQTMRRLMALALDRDFRFIDEDEGLGHDLDVAPREHVVKLAQGRRGGNLGFENSWTAVDLNKDDRFRHCFSSLGRNGPHKESDAAPEKVEVGALAAAHEITLAIGAAPRVGFGVEIPALDTSDRVAIGRE
jgi:hypothetical protein